MTGQRLTNSPVVDIIIPAYNEEEAIGLVIQGIPKEIVRDIIVCNNNSTDNTASTAEEAGAKVVHQPLRGYGRACLTAMNYIKSKPASEQPDIIVFLDADYADNPAELRLLLAPILAGHDLVIGSRTTGNYTPGSLTTAQIFGDWIATRLIHFFYSFRFTDLGPFRAIRWNKLLELDMQDKTFGWTVEMQVKAARQKLACVEVPVTYRKRIGKSKISGTLKGSILAGQKIIWTIFKWL